MALAIQNLDFSVASKLFGVDEFDDFNAVILVTDFSSLHYVFLLVEKLSIETQNLLLINTEALAFTCLQYKYFEKRTISPFPTVFSTRLERFLSLSSNLKLSSANSFSLEESKIFRLGKG